MMFHHLRAVPALSCRRAPHRLRMHFKTARYTLIQPWENCGSALARRGRTSLRRNEVSMLLNIKDFATPADAFAMARDGDRIYLPSQPQTYIAPAGGWQV